MYGRARPNEMKGRSHASYADTILFKAMWRDTKRGRFRHARVYGTISLVGSTLLADRSKEYTIPMSMSLVAVVPVSLCPLPAVHLSHSHAAAPQTLLSIDRNRTPTFSLCHTTSYSLQPHPPPNFSFSSVSTPHTFPTKAQRCTNRVSSNMFSSTKSTNWMLTIALLCPPILVTELTQTATLSPRQLKSSHRSWQTHVRAYRSKFLTAHWFIQFQPIPWHSLNFISSPSSDFSSAVCVTDYWPIL